MIDAIGKIIREEGYLNLGVNKIAKVAGIHKKLIYRYFDNADNLIETSTYLLTQVRRIARLSVA